MCGCKEILLKPNMISGKLHIVSEAEIPGTSMITDVPCDNLLEVYKVCLQLEELCEKERGIGISAVQAGLPWKLFLVKSDGSLEYANKNKYGYFINCHYKNTTEKRICSLEGCLSLRSDEGRLRQFQVERFTDIQLIGYQLILKKSYIVLEKLEVEFDLSLVNQSIIFQHEIDHQNGILISNNGRELLLWH